MSTTDGAEGAEKTPQGSDSAGSTAEATIEPIKVEEVVKAEPAVDAGVAKQVEPGKVQPLFDVGKLDILKDVYITLTIEIGRAQIKIRDLLSLSKGSIVELDKLAGEPVEIYANGNLISTGNIITANGKYCVRLASIQENNKVGDSVNGK